MNNQLNNQHQRRSFMTMIANTGESAYETGIKIEMESEVVHYFIYPSVSNGLIFFQLQELVKKVNIQGNQFYKLII